MSSSGGMPSPAAAAPLGNGSAVRHRDVDASATAAAAESADERLNGTSPSVSTTAQAQPSLKKPEDDRTAISTAASNGNGSANGHASAARMPLQELPRTTAPHQHHQQQQHAKHASVDSTLADGSTIGASTPQAQLHDLARSSAPVYNASPTRRGHAPVFVDDDDAAGEDPWEDESSEEEHEREPGYSVRSGSGSGSGSRNGHASYSSAAAARAAQQHHQAQLLAEREHLHIPLPLSNATSMSSMRSSGASGGGGGIESSSSAAAQEAYARSRRARERSLFASSDGNEDEWQEEDEPASGDPFVPRGAEMTAVTHARSNSSSSSRPPFELGDASADGDMTLRSSSSAAHHRPSFDMHNRSSSSVGTSSSRDRDRSSSAHAHAHAQLSQQPTAPRDVLGLQGIPLLPPPTSSTSAAQPAPPPSAVPLGRSSPSDRLSSSSGLHSAAAAVEFPRGVSRSPKKGGGRSPVLAPPMMVGGGAAGEIASLSPRASHAEMRPANVRSSSRSSVLSVDPMQANQGNGYAPAVTTPTGGGPFFTNARTGQSPMRSSRGGSFGNTTSKPASAGLGGSSAAREKEAREAEALLDQSAGPFSLWDYLREEVLATDFDAAQELKWERVTNFMTIPFWIEKIVTFGFLICLDSFLYTFTIMPLRLVVALWTWIVNLSRWLFLREKRFLSSSHKCDMLKALLVVLACYLLSLTTDASKMYHSVRGQDLVKLYVIFNVLEIADRLCCSFGQDILDTLFSRTTLARRRDGRQPYLRPLAFFTVSLGYIMAHTLVLFYQMVTLNVAINSYDNALLTLLVSNQFVEIKGSVFKKFEKENLFQLTCADIVERFQLALMLSFIALRNLIELAGAQADGASGPLPTSFTVLPSFNLLETIFTPVCMVLVSECLVDWLKHAFITKFNHIRPAVYGRFMDVLCRDLVIAAPSHNASKKTYKHSFVDQSPIVARRLGFAALPMACLLVRVFFQIMGMISDTTHFDECAYPDGHRTSQLARSAAFSLGAMDEKGTVHRVLQFIAQGIAWILTVIVAWTFLVGVKIILGMNLVSYASRRYATMHEREREEQLNARDRAPIGVHKEEQAYEAKLAQLLDKHDDNAPATNDVQAAGGKGKNTSLLDVSRYTMVRSRIW